MMAEHKAKSETKKSKKSATKATPEKKKSVAKKAAAKTSSKPRAIRAREYKTPVFSEFTTERKWYVIDLSDQVLGRAASVISNALRGKNKPTFTPHADTGDFVIAINAEKIRLTGNKWRDKMYHSYSGYLGGMKSMNARQLFDKNPTVLVSSAVWGMLPKGSLGRHLLTKLKVYVGSEHPHQAQKPEVLPIQ